MRIAANISLLFTEHPMLERVAAAAAAGFDGVEVQFPYEVPAAAFKEALDGAAMPLVLINLPAGNFAAGERGIAVNDNLPDLKAELIKRGAPVKDIRQLRDEIQAVTGVPKPVEFEDKVVALIEYRDGSIIDVIRQVKP